MNVALAVNVSYLLWEVIWCKYCYRVKTALLHVKPGPCPNGSPSDLDANRFNSSGIIAWISGIPRLRAVFKRIGKVTFGTRNFTTNLLICLGKIWHILPASSGSQSMYVLRIQTYFRQLIIDVFISLVKCLSSALVEHIEHWHDTHHYFTSHLHASIINLGMCFSVRNILLDSSIFLYGHDSCRW